MKMRIAQIMDNMVHHIFEAEKQNDWVDDPKGKKVPNWPPDPEGNRILLINVTGLGVNEGDGYDPETHECKPMPVAEWNEEEYEWDLTTRPESDVTGVNS
ncbi:MAG: hypothetical protein LBH43_12945 [Treponema sp.]|jgi:hypothetical protein|nr:hypothetical protein [Treponema sp.]